RPASADAPAPADQQPAVAGTGALPPVEPFPVGVLPKPLGRYVDEAARAHSCRPDYLAVPMLVLAGAAIGAARPVEIKSSWHEYPSLSASPVGDPGGAKSPALKLVSDPVPRRQGELEAEFKRRWRDHERQLEAQQGARRKRRPTA